MSKDTFTSMIVMPIFGVMIGFGLATAYWAPKIDNANRKWSHIADDWRALAVKNNDVLKKCLHIIAPTEQTQDSDT